MTNQELAQNAKAAADIVHTPIYYVDDERAIIITAFLKEVALESAKGPYSAYVETRDNSLAFVGCGTRAKQFGTLYFDLNGNFTDLIGRINENSQDLKLKNLTFDKKEAKNILRQVLLEKAEQLK